ncbi:MAG: flagellar biosynthesis anti-sigma factor FlgM [Bdellovibrionota bacterium]|jgi:anti-sigma28 factor (negative regulator of flagellin synthesis)
MGNTTRVESADINYQIEQNRLRLEAERNRTEQKGLADDKNITSVISSISDSTELSLAKKIQEDLIGDRSERIAELKKKIESGTYRVDSTTLAESLSSALDEEIFFSKLGNE